MGHPRAFLFLLLLATVMCVVLVQFGLDNWVTTNTVFRLALEVNGTDLRQRNGGYQPLLQPDPFQQNTTYSSSTLTSTRTTTTTPRPTKAATRPPPPPRKTLSLKRTLAELPLADNTSKVQTNAGKSPPRSLFDGDNPKPGVSTRTSVVTSIRSFPGQAIPLDTKRYGSILKQPVSIQSPRQRTDPYRVLQSVPTVTPEKVVRVLLVAYFRCGSTFVGDILQQNWKTFYHFEPLHYMTYDQRIGDDKVGEALDLLSSLFRCNFTQFPNYVQWAWRPENRFLFRRNLYLWYMCRARPSVCFMPEFLAAVCQRSMYQVMKVTRLHLRHVELFLRSNPDLNIKVVYLVRDPRGIISSRKGIDWCNTTNCSDPTALCSEMAEDIQVSQEIQQVDPGRCMRLRYEDICVHPEFESRKTLMFLGLPFTKTAEKFLKTHTIARKADGLDPYSTRRNSSTTSFAWKHRLNYTEILSVQEACKNVIDELGFKIVTSSKELQQPQTDVKNGPQKQMVRKQRRENG